MVKELILDGRPLGGNRPPYLIAEIGVNHGCDLVKAKELIALAKQGGADAAKFQTYKAEKIASVQSPSYWDLDKEPTDNQFKLFQKYDKFCENDYIELAHYCNEIGIAFLSTPFDIDAVDFLDQLVPFFKIASADLTNIPLLRKVAATKKPVVLSTGASNISEIDLALDELRSTGCSSIVLMHCVLCYPTRYEDANLNMIQGLIHAYPDLFIGYSDHTLPDANMDVLFTAWLKGACIIEKHFTYDKSIKGNDHFHSMDILDLQKLRDRIEALLPMLGSQIRKVLSCERSSRLNARRSLVLTRAVCSGEIVNETDLICKRPGTGISPLHLDAVRGGKYLADFQKDHVLQWSDVSLNET